jgi:probable phosphomutase (TIGR03848 family)
MPGVQLDEVGRDQAERTAQRLAAVPLAALVSSPLERCRETAEAILASQREGAGRSRATGSEGADRGNADEGEKAGDAQPAAVRGVILESVALEPALTECGYGEWQGRAINELVREDLWRHVQASPASVTFPGGEAMLAMQARAVKAIRRHDAAVTAEHGARAVWAAVSHGDVIKSVLADALGLPFDRFQSIVVGPASVSIVHYGSQRSGVIAMNTHGGDLGWLKDGVPDEDAPVGGGAAAG